VTDDVVIRAEGLGKKYLIGHAAERERYVALRDVLARGASKLWRKTARMARPRAMLDTVEEFWALRDVSFEVRRGKVLGIIGRNGAGKTTLLKILSRITAPSEGRVTIRGRVASLLEVGTGFHPELTGRENIYLNGAILGMTRTEIRSKFDEIVTFAEVEQFLDTPVKRYSSGMYVRLAFAVAAHLEPEILIVDEVLAVGDAQFQKKCLGKISEVAGGGRTVLFVSHNMAAIQALCHSGLFLSEGHCVGRGPTGAIIRQYLFDINRLAAVPLTHRTDREGSGDVRFVSVDLEGESERKVTAFQCGAEATLCVHIDNHSNGLLRNFQLSIGIDNELGHRIALLDSEISGAQLPNLTSGRHCIKCLLPKMPLVPGRYLLTLYASTNGTVTDWIKNAATIEVEQGDFYRTGRFPEIGQCVFLIDHKFDIGTGRCADTRS
jgi:lipopolysaccharide transport system ATP-binding protein